MNNFKKIVLITPSLQMGGMERVLTLIANECILKGYEVSILCLITRDNIAYNLNPLIKVISSEIKYRNNIFFKLKTLFYLIKTLSKINPNTILCFSEVFNPFAILGAKIINKPIFISDRSNPYKRISRSKSYFRRLLYPLANGMISQTELAKEVILKKKYNSNVVVIPNPLRVIDDSIIKLYPQRIISVGRLIPSKNFIQLIEIFHSLKRRKGWELIILGDGADFDLLTNKIKKLKLKDSVKLLGAVKNVDIYFSQSSIFAFTSMSEGFPNALSEAMAFPLSCIAYNCPAGPSDIIIDGENGFLIGLGNKEEFSKKLQVLMENSDKIRDKFINNAINNRKKFSKEKIVNDYLEFILNIPNEN